jgi:hypothetical protein
MKNLEFVYYLLLTLSSIQLVLHDILYNQTKPYISKKKTEAEALEEIKKYYYERYKKTGKLDTLEPWNN